MFHGGVTNTATTSVRVYTPAIVDLKFAEKASPSPTRFRTPSRNGTQIKGLYPQTRRYQP